jgi:histidyl-tRNA synthetase
LNERGISGESASKLMWFFEGLAGIERAAGFVDVGEPGTERAAYNANVLGRLVEFIGAHETGAKGVDELREVLQFANANGTDQRIKLDPTLARGLAYYTGAILEINVPDLSGSLGGGGRYDNLVGMFLGKDVPACGFSLGLERIIVVMSERDMFPAELVSSPADVMVTIWNEDSVGESIALATELRSKGLRVDQYPDADKLAKQFKYASARGITFVAIVGDDERARGEVAIKDMRSGEQRSVTRSSAADEFRNELNSV